MCVCVCACMHMCAWFTNRTVLHLLDVNLCVSGDYIFLQWRLCISAAEIMYFCVPLVYCVRFHACDVFPCVCVLCFCVCDIFLYMCISLCSLFPCVICFHVWCIPMFVVFLYVD